MSNCDDTLMVLVLGILLISNLMKIWIRRNLKFWKFFFFFLIFEYVNNDDTIPLGILLIWDFDKDLNSKKFFSFSSFLFVSFREHDDDTMMVCDFNKDLNLMKSPNSGDFSLPLWGIRTMILRFSREKVVRKFYRNLYESFRYAIFNILFNRPKL